ncbi:MAG: DNA-binding protein WhiA [Ruminococcaceae bacterium]|nr:DNA-binding protein WhiA [Oscillospiraceae bacterium]
MSFSSDVKEELCEVTWQPCCRAALAYGLLETGRAFSAAAVSMQTERASVAQLYRTLLRDVCGVTAVHESEREGGFHLLSVDGADDRLGVLSRFGHAEGEVSLRLNRANLECENCAAAYLAGAFLACGAVTDPQVDYHLEFHLPQYNLSRDLIALLRELGLRPKFMSRKSNQVVYFKESEQIEDCLTRMRATSASLELMSVKMVKDIRNNVNRLANCENANIDKTVAAAAAQVEAIRRIERHGGLDALPSELQELARLRLEYPEMSLRELGETLTEPISRSGVNHRLRRIMEFAEDIK